MATVLIPSYEPDARLLDLVCELITRGMTSIVIVDDGSGADYDDIFAAAEECGCKVLKHDVNRGKGCALKTGFRFIRDSGMAGGIVCADSDGQHLPDDIRKIADAVADKPNEIVLGSRRFAGKVPLRSRFGNWATRRVYAFTTGMTLHDTQTGLRGYSVGMMEWLCRIPGERFEYEMNVLLAAPAAGYAICEIPIETVYMDGNRSSHFRPFADSLKIYYPILKFSASSLLAALIDFILLLALSQAANLFIAVVASRAGSSLFNYFTNRTYVFATGKTAPINKSMPRYYTLVLLVVLLNYGFMHIWHERIGLPIIPAKLLTEAALFALSFWAQRRFVY